MTTSTVGTTWQPIDKTPAMRAMEVRHAGKDIRDILLDALINAESDKLAARTLGIDNTTLSAWISKLQISNLAAQIRGERQEQLTT